MWTCVRTCIHLRRESGRLALDKRLSGDKRERYTRVTHSVCVVQPISYGELSCEYKTRNHSPDIPPISKKNEISTMRATMSGGGGGGGPLSSFIFSLLLSTENIDRCDYRDPFNNPIRSISHFPARNLRNKNGSRPHYFQHLFG